MARLAKKAGELVGLVTKHPIRRARVGFTLYGLSLALIASLGVYLETRALTLFGLMGFAGYALEVWKRVDR